MLSRNEQDTSHKLHMWHSSLADNHILVSIILLCSAAVLCLGPSSAQEYREYKMTIDSIGYHSCQRIMNQK